MDFKDSFNTQNSDVYKDILNATETNCQQHLSKDCSVTNLTLRSGSTIADFTLSSSSQGGTQVQLVIDEMLNQLAEKYPVMFVSTKKFNTSVPSEQIIAGGPVIVTCGPPPTNFGSDLTVEWTFKDKIIQTDKPSQDRTSKYTITKFFDIHEGTYVCKMNRADGATFTQSSVLKSKPAPLIFVDPVRGTVKCGDSVTLQCSVNSDYKVQFNGLDLPTLSPDSKISYVYTAPEGCTTQQKTIICQETNSVAKETIILTLTPNVVCEGKDGFSAGQLGFEAVASCEKGKVGNKTAVCKIDGTYGDFQDNCVLEVIHNLLLQSEELDEVTLPGFLKDLKDAAFNNTKTITDSPATIRAMVQILENVAKRADSLNITIFEESTKNIMESAGILTTDTARKSWLNLNNENSTNQQNKFASSSFLRAFEGITTSVVNQPLKINTPHIIFTKTNFTNFFSENFNSSVEIDIPEAGGGKQSITVILFASMDIVLPAREKATLSSTVINGKVALIRPNSDITNISIAFDVLNDTLGNPKCVFWKFDLFDGLGGWSNDGCSFVYSINGTVSCNCNHTTSFSILMSPSSPDDPVLNFITYIGVGISMACLVICLIIEGIVWRKIRRNTTSYLRHVSIVNIAVSLLIADIWFIIGAAISNTKNAPACTATTFFIHFFYLALFFWMLASGLLLLYRTVSVFEGGLSKMSMLIIGFCLGYGAPLIIATITIAATAPSDQYIRENAVCWLNWDGSKALLGFVIPALMIVVINLIILIVVIAKLLRRRVGENAAQAGEKHVLVVIARSLAVLTPFFGLTWGLGVGTMVSPQNKGIHITFALFNSLQGFFILVFGTLLDRTVRSALTPSQLSTSQARTTSTGTGTLSSGVGNFFRRLRKGRHSSNGYHVSSNVPTASNI
ncbi:hypothetical protein GOODEAATRI_011509 [Goodea atripinnis]|uniref:Adhesion G protein-coupled receptor F5-like n=1 Tax=Goodea atripinnis TaxID=208336 RepID=A0ABV0P3C7_9TELE